MSLAKRSLLGGAVLTLSLVALTASAQSLAMIEDIPCTVIGAVFSAVVNVGSALIFIMLLYGAGKYAFAADDPGARKQGKNMMIHAIIGAIIMGLTGAIITLTDIKNKLGLCSDVHWP